MDYPLFDLRRQLIVYHFMFGPDWDAGCEGCSWVVDAMSHPAHLRARDTTLVLVSRTAPGKLEAYRNRMGWDLPRYSSLDTARPRAPSRTRGLAVESPQPRRRSSKRSTAAAPSQEPTPIAA
jgi:hypothetical protein